MSVNGELLGRGEGASKFRRRRMPRSKRLKSSALITIFSTEAVSEFKKIEVYGFKSFADKLEMKFDKPITAIVGPNGCGKSNVSDAIRWVLGEQSARVLRGKSMQDLIFSGTERRKSMSYCEASLIFDNTNRIFRLKWTKSSFPESCTVRAKASIF